MAWHTFKNYFPKVAIGLFVLAGLVLLLTPKTFWPVFYDLPYLGWAALVCAVLIALVPRRFKAPLALIAILNASGDLGLYELYRYGFEYDKLIHFLSPMVATLTLIPIVGTRRTIVIVITGAVAWELFEYLADALIKTHLFGVYRHQIFRDTVVDFVMNLSGLVVGIFWFRYVNKKRASNLGAGSS